MKKKSTTRGKTFRPLLMCIFLLFSSMGIYAQDLITVNGTVIEKSTKDPLIGVTIAEKGTTNGTLSDIDGNFTMRVNSGATLIVSYMGYLTQEVKVSANTPLTIQLEEDSKVLGEVVVVGYGVQKKVNLTGAVSAIDGDVIASKSVSDVRAALQGEMPGVAVLRSSGKPGSETSGIRIRGFSSINDAKALVLIDGVEGDMTLLNPNDIESISVLKDAAASSIYGAKAAAGVVLITTKNGTANQNGRAKITYNGYFAVNTPSRMPKRLPAWEEQEFINESRIQQSGTPEWNAEQSSWVGNPNFNYRPNNNNGRWDFFQATNWIDEGTRDYTTQQSHSVSVSGGSKEMNYLVSAGYFTKSGILKYGPDKNERYNLRIRLNSELNKYMDLAIIASYNGKFVETNPYNADNILERLYRVRGRQPIFNPEEDINESPYNGDLQVNPIDLMKNGGKNENRYEAYTGKGEITIKNLVKGLRFKLSASRQASYYNSKVTKRTLTWNDRVGNKRFDANNPNELEKKKNYDFHDNFEALAYYDLNIDKHSFNFLAGTSYENYRKDEVTGLVKSLNSNDFFSFNGYDASLATNTKLEDMVSTNAMMSYFGRINYNFADRYLFEANIRYDGSSKLEPGNRWKAFPSFSGAWRINEESWFDVPVIDNLKARASWGQLGIGTSLDDYDYLTILKGGLLMGDRYFYQERLAAKEKSWEIIESTNIGIDVGVLNNRLTFTGDYFWKYNNDMLIPYNLPSLVGVKTPYGNIGRLKTWGWEFQIGWKDKVGEVSYQASFNLSDAQNKLLEYNGTSKIEPGAVDYIEGYPINTIWGYKTDGFWSSRQEYLDYKAANPGYQSFNDANVSGGDIRYVAQGKADHLIGAGGGTPENSGDLVCLGNSNGRYFYGFNLGVQWRGFDLSMLWQGVGKRKILVDTNTLAPFQATANMPWTIHRDYWTPENQNAFWPRLYNGNTFNYHPSDKWVQDASYIRLKNVQIGYNVPVKKTIIERLRVYVSGDDIWEHSDLLKVFDPEVGNKAKANYYPFFRTWSVGLNVTF